MANRPVVFIHGLWLHASSWQAWADLFHEAGYAPLMPGWPGDSGTAKETRMHPELVAGVGVQEATEHYADIIRRLPESPVIIGHSFGGLLAQELLGQNLGIAAVAIDAAQPKGVLPLPLAQLRSSFPALGHPSRRDKAVMLTREEFYYGFANTLSDEETDELYEKWAIPSPGKPLFEAAFANFNPHATTEVDTRNETRGPLLLIGGGRDHTVPEAITRSTDKKYRHSSAITDLKIFPDRGHSLTIDHGWREVAQYSLDWLHDRLPRTN